MRASWLVARGELRRRLGSLLVVALVTAVTTGAVATALAGAHRTATSVDRFRDRANASDGSFQVNAGAPFAQLLPQVERLQRRVVATGHVEQVGQRWLVNGFFDHAPIRDIAVYSDPGHRFGNTIERPRVLRGRMPARDAPDEIALNEQAADLLHTGVGARLTIRTWSSDDLGELFGGQGSPGFHGPVLHLRVVGVVRTLDGLSGDVERGSPYGFAGPRFLAAHPGAGPWPPTLYVRTRGGAAGFRRVSQTLRRDPDVGATIGTGTTAGAAYLDGVQRGADGSATGLLVFAAAAAAAGALVVAQSVQRHLAARAAVGRQLVELGLTRSTTAAALTLPVASAAVAGSLAGVAVAVLSSRLLPIGVAGRAEPDPGIRVDPLALVLCGILAAVLVAAFGFLWARVRIARVGPAPTPPRRVALAVRAALGLGAPPSVATGVQLATDRSAGSGPVPIRTAFAGVALAVAAVVAAGVVVHSHESFVSSPARWGRTWYSEPDAFGGASVDDYARRLANDERIAAAARFGSSGLRIGGEDVSAYALAPIRGDMAMTLRRGRLPTRTDEIALGEQTLADAHARIGDRVRVAAQNGSRRTLRVTGVAVLPPSAGDEHELDRGAVTTRATLRHLASADDYSEDFVLRYPDGADVPRLERELAHDYGVEFNAFTEPQVPGAVRRLSDTRTIAVALAWFFGALGLLSLVHALWVGTRRRRVHLTMLRVLGMRRWQVLCAVLVQALLLVAVAVVVGIPLGLVVGRAAWHVASGGLGALTDAVTPWALIGTMLPVALLAALLVAWWPGRRAATTDLGPTLRTE